MRIILCNILVISSPYVIAANKIPGKINKKAAATQKTLAAQPIPEVLAEPAVTPKSIYLQAAFDKTIEAMPNGFMGHDVQTIYMKRELVNKESIKSEFETTAEYEIRKNKLADRQEPLYGQVYFDSLLAIETGNNYMLAYGGMQYDADTHTATISIELSQDSKQFHGLENFTHRADYETREYTGTNSYGASVGVTLTTGRRWDVALDAKNLKPYKKYSSGRDGYFLQVPMDTATAMEYRATAEAYELGVIFIGKLDNAMPAWKENYYSSPTFDLPYKSDYDIYFQKLDLQVIFVYSRLNGKIFAKINI
jgi:hypothetical protein